MLLNQRAEAEAELRTARAAAYEQGMRSVLWRIDLVLGNLYSVQRRHEEAERSFVAARALIDELAANLPGETLRDTFLNQAMTVAPRLRSLSSRRAEKLAFGGLTEREREVAMLIGQGKYNREIADELVVSARTVESHVSNIMFKLGFTSRRQIATWAAEKGLMADR